MNFPTSLAVAYFKRNPKAKAVHVVLNSVFPKLERAEMFRKAVGAKKVTSILRTEVADQLGKSADPEKQSKEPGTTSPNNK